MFLLEDCLVDSLAKLNSAVFFHIKRPGDPVEKCYSFDPGGMKGSIVAKATITIGAPSPKEPIKKEETPADPAVVIGTYAISQKIAESREAWLGKMGWRDYPTWFDLKVNERSVPPTPPTPPPPPGKTVVETPIKIETTPEVPPISGLPAEKTCDKCRNKVKISARFCNRCGYDFEPATVMPTTVTQTTPTPAARQNDKKTCGNCGAHVNKEAKFCNKCGGKLENTCGKCGDKVIFGAKFCPMCGNPLESSSPRDPGKTFCPHCGNEVKLPANFCLNCGKPI